MSSSALHLARERTAWLLFFLCGLLACASVLADFEALLARELEAARAASHDARRDAEAAIKEAQRLRSLVAQADARAQWLAARVQRAARTEAAMNSASAMKPARAGGAFFRQPSADDVVHVQGAAEARRRQRASAQREKALRDEARERRAAASAKLVEAATAQRELMRAVMDGSVLDRTPGPI